MRRVWDERRINRLRYLAETKDRYEIAAELGVSWKVVANRMAENGIKPRAALLSLRECIRRTGYLKHQLYRAKKGLEQHWRNSERQGRAIGITEDQLDALCDYLKNEP